MRRPNTHCIPDASGTTECQLSRNAQDIYNDEFQRRSMIYRKDEGIFYSTQDRKGHGEIIEVLLGPSMIITKSVGDFRVPIPYYAKFA